MGELWRYILLHRHQLGSHVVRIVDLLLPWLESPLYYGRVDLYERVLIGAPWTASPFWELNQGYNHAVSGCGISHGNRCHQPGWRHLPCTWSLSMHLVSFVAPGLAASLRSCAGLGSVAAVVHLYEVAAAISCSSPLHLLRGARSSRNR